MQSNLFAACETLPAVLRRTLDLTCNSGAFNWREGGYWRRMSTEEFCAQVRRFALGLVSLGFEPGDHLGILAAPSPFWLIADLAAMTVGGVSVPLFPNMSGEHLRFAIDNTRMRILVVTGEPAWELARPVARDVRHVITKGVHADRGHHVDWQSVLEQGDEVALPDPGRFARCRDAVKPDDTATIIHTSGSTGKPKGVVLTHRNLVSQIRGAAEVFPLEPGTDRALSCLPLAHVFERMVMYYYVGTGVSVHFCEDIKQVGVLMREIHPTVMTVVPRLIEKIHARILSGIAESGSLSRNIGQWALDRADHHDPDATATMADAAAEQILYKKVRSALGGRLRYLIVGGAPLADDLYRFLLNVGVPTFTGYGLTEAAPVATVNRPGEAHVGTAGRPYPGVEVRIGDGDEILVRGPNIMRGYHRDPEATAATIDGEGWLHTGDQGRFDEVGRLIITGRIKELFKSSNGKYVCPVPIEQALMAHPLVDQAMVVAEGRRFVSVLLFPNPDELRRCKQRHGKAESADAGFLAGPEISAEIGELVDGINRQGNHWERIGRWLMLAAAPTVENDQLTPTLKLRRHVLTQRYAAEIDALYQESAVDPAKESLAPS